MTSSLVVSKHKKFSLRNSILLTKNSTHKTTQVAGAELQIGAFGEKPKEKTGFYFYAK